MDQNTIEYDFFSTFNLKFYAVSGDFLQTKIWRLERTMIAQYRCLFGIRTHSAAQSYFLR